VSTTFQANLTDTEYNGWTNYETWNVALWINNNQGLYHLAQQCGDYQTFVKEIGVGYSTPDGVKYADPKVNVIQINSDVFDF
jgi:hypothetical protein